MAHFLKSIMGNGHEEQTTLAEDVIARVEQKCASLEQATSKADAAARRLDQLSQPISELDKSLSALTGRVGGVEQKLKDLEGSLPDVTSLVSQTEAADKGQRRIEKQLSNAAEELERLQTNVGEMSHKAEMALCLKEQLDEFMGLKDPLESLQVRTADLAKLVDALDGNVGEIRENHEQLSKLSNETESKLESYDDRFQKLLGNIAETEAKMGEYRHSCAELSKVAAGSADIKRQLATLQALTDSVSQKISTIELQREVVERASRQAGNLHELMRRIDIQMRAQQQRAGEVKEIQTWIEELKQTQESLVEQTGEIQTRQTEIQETDKASLERIDSLQADLKHSMERLQLEREGVDSVSQRIVDLRRDLTELETRYEKLEDSSQELPELKNGIEDLSGKLAVTRGEIDRLGEYSQQAQALGSELERIDATAAAANSQLAQVEDARPAAESMLRQFNELHRNREQLKEALDQVQFAATEVQRFREDQAETERWMAGVQTLLNELQNKARDLSGTKSSVEVIRKDLERVSELMSGVESQSSQVENLGETLSNLTALGAQLDERSKGLVVRMDVADGRLTSLSARASEAAAVEASVTATAAAVSDLEQRSEALGSSLEALESQSRDLAEMSANVEQLRIELDQRQQTLEKTAEHLEKSSELRREAAATAQDLEDRNQQLSATLKSSETRMWELQRLADDMDDKYTGLMFAEKRMNRFEDQLEEWEATEAKVTDTLNQLTERESTVQAMQAEIRQLLKMAEQTVADVRSINGAKQEIGVMRVELDATIERLNAADEAAVSLEDRRRQIEHAEQKLSRAEALMLEIQSAMETLNGQKALMDHVIEKTGVMAFQLKHAEAVIDALKEERELTGKVRAAVDEVQDVEVKEMMVS